MSFTLVFVLIIRLLLLVRLDWVLTVSLNATLKVLVVLPDLLLQRRQRLSSTREKLTLTKCANNYTSKANTEPKVSPPIWNCQRLSQTVQDWVGLG